MRDPVTRNPRDLDGLERILEVFEV